MAGVFGKSYTNQILLKKSCRSFYNIRRTFQIGRNDEMCESRKRVFRPTLMTGIQPTGFPHIGNYLGAIQQSVKLQNSESYDKIFFSIVDLHSITVPQNPTILRQNIINLACSLLACGLDKPQTVLFQQSSVPHHTELAWILGCLATLNKLDHLPQWKEKSPSKEDVSLGLYSYPVLQAADVLIYRATDVPVGDDQIKHMEFARHLARQFNKIYSPVFPIPKQITSQHIRIKSLRDPIRKMSKSEKDSRGRIELFDSPDEIREKLRKAVTDLGTGGMIGYDSQGRPGISNIIDIHAAVEGSTPDQICSECAHLTTVEYKERAAEAIIEMLKPIRARIVHLRNEPQHVVSVLSKGNEIAAQNAAKTCAEVKKLIGLS
ncbi:hypothetical protein HELRODRAFT_93491 [Helobdella robusta]|uniref:Tryptophan--tRNA ligase, mitochondrial n=1 Tax=Helobdella robusta TaxID=6412 RepID=T1G8W0_HELRO|nr:hypothetical protein HELRODRAFT_93491 [Helobdella robusta]ESO12829.1 hypothetical protein HELRODRAFT_93491 [Helobdella robusta]